MADIPSEVRVAREAYGREYFDRFRQAKEAGAVENNEWLVDAESGLFCSRPPWWQFDTCGRPLPTAPVADLDGRPILEA